MLIMLKSMQFNGLGKGHLFPSPRDDGSSAEACPDRMKKGKAREIERNKKTGAPLLRNSGFGDSDFAVGPTNHSESGSLRLEASRG
jgi:hypothetical protein